MDDDEMHNLYPIIYNKQMSRGFEDYTGLRSMIYSSGGYAGIQQYSATWRAIPAAARRWCICSTTRSAAMSTPAAIWTYLSGAAFTLASFSPGRSCNWAYWRQPWLDPAAQGDVPFYAKLRYRMLPYIYAAAHRAATPAIPSCAPCPWHIRRWQPMTLLQQICLR